MKKRYLGIILSGLLTLGLATSITAFADNDNYDFRFTIYGDHRNGKEAVGRYRQTTDPYNEWKVNLQSSSEGDGTITEFWLENASAENVSPTVEDKVGSGSHYERAYNSASQKNVWLTGQNNNYNSDAYMVSGVWDEETR